MIEEKDKENLKEKIGALEAILFVYGEPLAIRELSHFLKLSETACQELINFYKEELQNNNRGLMIVEENKKVQLVTKVEFKNLIEEIKKEEFKETLTPAALEVLAIIAYLGPISRSFIDQIRGVNSSFILRNLLIRGLVERKIDSEKSNVYLYNISHDFLKHLGLSKKEDLPNFGLYKDLLDKFMVEENRE